MKVSDIKPVLGPERVKAAEAPAAEVTGPKDRVSVQATKEAESAIQVAQKASGGRRAARLERLEAEVRAGSFRADPSRVAAQILADAEVDARIAAMMAH
ncbi:MAG: flagellar biosynthesis protein FlgM [Pseudomonadota bacterium]